MYLFYTLYTFDQPNEINFCYFASYIWFDLQDVETIKSSADEMELYAFVSRKFRQVYTRQEHMRTYKTYDRIEVCALFLGTI